MKCSFYSAFKTSMILITFILDFALIGISTYFTSKSTNSLNIGLNGVSLEGQQYSFSEFNQICNQRHFSSRICRNTESLYKAGAIFEVLIVLDIFILSSYAISLVIQSCYIRKIMKENLMVKELPKFHRVLFYAAYKCRIIFISHPAIVNMALGIWVWLSNIEDYSGEVQIREGIIIGIFQGFLSLLSIAGYFWEVSDIKRRNLTKTLKLKENNTKPIENKKENSMKPWNFSQSQSDKFIIPLVKI